MENWSSSNSNWSQVLGDGGNRDGTLDVAGGSQSGTLSIGGESGPGHGESLSSGDGINGTRGLPVLAAESVFGNRERMMANTGLNHFRDGSGYIYDGGYLLIGNADRGVTDIASGGNGEKAEQSNDVGVHFC